MSQPVRRAIALVLTVLVLMSCQGEPVTKPIVLPQVECRGGNVVFGMAGPTCAMATPDAGKACGKASDCTGFCLAETMTCSALSPLFGCLDVVMDDGQTAGLCVD